MFTGIIEDLGQVVHLEKEGKNIHFTIQSNIASELKIDQSVAHNGVCLTVVKLDEDQYTVTAVDETLQKTSLGQLKVGKLVNLERSMTMQQRLDGHIVQGHVDTTGICEEIREVEGSWYFKFSYPEENANLLVDKGSVCINGVSLTVISPDERSFSVAIIPYTYEHTNFKEMKVGDAINLEFDILGKYIARHARLYLQEHS